MDALEREMIISKAILVSNENLGVDIPSSKDFWQQIAAMATDDKKLVKALEIIQGRVLSRWKAAGRPQ